MTIKIRTKLIALAVFSLLLTCAVSYLGVKISFDYPKDVLQLAQTSAALRSSMEGDMMHDALHADVSFALAAGQAKNEADGNTVLQDVGDHSKAFTEAIDAITKMTVSEALKTAATEASGEVASYVKAASDLSQVAVRDPVAGQKGIPEFQEHFKAMETYMAALGDKIEAEMTAIQVRAQADSAASQSFIFLLVIAALVLLPLASFLLIRSVMRPIRGVSRELAVLAQGGGDLTSQLPLGRNKDELHTLALSFNKFLENLHALVKEIKVAQQQLAENGGELQQSMKVTRHGVESIQTSLREARSGMEGQTVSVAQSVAATEQIKHRVGTVDQLLRSQNDHVSESSASVEEMLANLASVTNTVEKMAKSFSTLVSASEVGREALVGVTSQIADVSQQSEALVDANAAIASIAAQTNLLAMNAAIEAAHAGEAGRGFSVVADEIRKLAENASGQARTTDEGLRLVQTSIVTVTENSKQAEEAFEQIVQKINEANDLASSVRDSLLEQSQGSSRVMEAIAKMLEATREITEGALQMRSGSDAVSQEMMSLQASHREMGMGVETMSTGTGEIVRRVDDVNELVDRNSRLIASVQEKLGRFTVQD